MYPNRMEVKQIVDHPPCIWMQAGIVPHKFCRLKYQCAACAYDRAMRRTAAENKSLKEQGKMPKGKRGRIVFWKDKLRELPAWKQPPPSDPKLLNPENTDSVASIITWHWRHINEHAREIERWRRTYTGK